MKPLQSGQTQFDRILDQQKADQIEKQSIKRNKRIILRTLLFLLLIVSIISGAIAYNRNYVVPANRGALWLHKRGYDKKIEQVRTEFILESKQANGKDSPRISKTVEKRIHLWLEIKHAAQQAGLKFRLEKGSYILHDDSSTDIKDIKMYIYGKN